MDRVVMLHYVRVGVALSRPPKIDEWRRYCIVAATAQEAELIAQQMAACSSVMPVESQWESSHRAGPVEPFGGMICTCWAPPWQEDIDVAEEIWEIQPDCPYHAEDTAAWAALDVDHGNPSEERQAGTCDCDGFIPPTVDRLMEVQGVMGSIAGDPPTPETANAGGPDIDDTPVRRCWCGTVGPHGNHPSSTPPPPALDVPHVCETSRCWQECRNRTDTAPATTLSPGRVECARCDDWSYGFSDAATAADALIALRRHRTVITEGGLTECRFLSQQRRPTWLDRVRCWLHRDLHH